MREDIRGRPVTQRGGDTTCRGSRCTGGSSEGWNRELATVHPVEYGLQFLNPLLRLLCPLLLILDLLAQYRLPPFGLLTDPSEIPLKTVNDCLGLRLTILHHGDETPEPCRFTRIRSLLFSELTFEILDARQRLSELM